jgi:hypothetical protein
MDRSEESMIKVAQGDADYVDVPLEAVHPDRAKNTWSVTLKNGCSLFVSPDGSVEHGDRKIEAPTPADTLRLWGKDADQLGSTVRGIALLSSERQGSVVVTKVHTLYRYRTQEQQEEQDRKWVEENTAKKKAEWNDNREETAARIAALPERFRERIEFFMRQPDWGWEFGFYELFCCEEAVKIAKALETREKIEAFASMKADRQRELVPDLSEDHSGNTFGAATTLAHCFVTTPQSVFQVHGAMCPAVGCRNYGCWLTTLAEHIKDGVLIGTSSD